MWWLLIFFFLILFGICGRLYYRAPTYLETKIYHSYGLHICIIALIFYIIKITPYENIKRKISSCYLALYSLVGAAMFFYVQSTGDHVAKTSAWLIARKSGASFIGFGLIQDVFIPQSKKLNVERNKILDPCKYFFINTRVKISQKRKAIKELIGQDWSINNCCFNSLSWRSRSS